jgi:hypothetical protein
MPVSYSVTWLWPALCLTLSKFFDLFGLKEINEMDIGWWAFRLDLNQKSVGPIIKLLISEILIRIRKVN